MTVEIQKTGGDNYIEPFRFIATCDLCYENVFTRAFKEVGNIAVNKRGDYKDMNIICNECKNKIMSKILEYD